MCTHLGEFQREIGDDVVPDEDVGEGEGGDAGVVDRGKHHPLLGGGYPQRRLTLQYTFCQEKTKIVLKK